VLTRSDLEWLAFAIAAAIAAHFVAIGGTPIDRHLPFVVVLLAVSGWIAAARLVQMVAPLLLAAAMSLSDDRMRIFAYGVIVAAAFAWAVFKAPKTRLVSAILAATGVMLLRWIPCSDVPLWREIVVLAGALAIVFAMRERTPMTIAAALAVAAVTPIYPARLLLFPFVVTILLLLPIPRIIWAVPFAISAYFARYSIATLCVVAALAFLVDFVEDSRRRLSVVRVPLYVGAIALFALWPWSGIVARAMPRFLAAEEASRSERAVWAALEAGRSVSIDAPPQMHYMVITASGANASRLPPGWLVGRVEVVGRGGGVIRRDLRISDIADFGFTRREHFFASRNPIPRTPLDDIHGYGIGAWLHTAGRIAMASADEIASVRATAATDLPPATKLQIEAVEFE
jgi:hypothetical protein